MDLVDITPELWELIMKTWRATWRPPGAEDNLKLELRDYKILRKGGVVEPGRYIRYMPRGFVNCNLRRGGWLHRCGKELLHLKDGRRAWRVSRRDNFIFVRNADPNDGYMGGRKPLIRLLAEEAVRQDDMRKQTQRIRIRFQGDDEDEDEEE